MISSLVQRCDDHEEGRILLSEILVRTQPDPSLLMVPVIPPSAIRRRLVLSHQAELRPYQRSQHLDICYLSLITPVLRALRVPLKPTGHSGPSSGAPQTSPLPAAKEVNTCCHRAVRAYVDNSVSDGHNSC